MSILIYMNLTVYMLVAATYGSHNMKYETEIYMENAQPWETEVTAE